MNQTEKNIQAFLLFRGGSVSKKMICQQLKISKEEFENALGNIKSETENTGLTVIDNGVSVALSTSISAEEFISDLKEKEYTSSLSTTAKEILSLVMYVGPISKQDLDFLRGVNSQFILRKLVLRGLIKAEENTKDGRVKMYRITPEFMAYLGIKKIEELPEYEKFRGTVLEALEELKNRMKE